jgi:two-component system LytT family response regulator
VSFVRAIIVDDEPLARGVIREHLEAHPDILIVAECANGFEAVKSITELEPDILFLDIQMPKLTGFEVLDLLETRPAVVFVTAYDSFALKAFDVHAVDYLLKPFSRDRFEEALARAVAGAGMQTGAIAGLLRDSRTGSRPIERILIRDGQKVHVVPVDSVTHIEAQDDYVAVHAGGKTYLKQESLVDLEAALDPARFIRIHRSSLLNIDSLVRLEPYAKESHVAILRDGSRLPVSRSGYDRLKGLLT